MLLGPCLLLPADAPWMVTCSSLVWPSLAQCLRNLKLSGQVDRQLSPIVAPLRIMAVSRQAAMMGVLQRQQRRLAGTPTAARNLAWLRIWWDPTSLLSNGPLAGAEGASGWPAEAVMRDAVIVAGLILLPQLAAAAATGCVATAVHTRDHRITMGMALSVLVRSTGGWLAACFNPAPEQQQVCLEAVGLCAAGCASLLEAEAASEPVSQDDITNSAVDVLGVLGETVKTFQGLAGRIDGWKLPGDDAAVERFVLAATGAAEAAIRLLGLLVRQGRLVWLHMLPEGLESACISMVAGAIHLLGVSTAIVLRGKARHGWHASAPLQQAVFWASASIAKVVAWVAATEEGGNSGGGPRPGEPAGAMLYSWSRHHLSGMLAIAATAWAAVADGENRQHMSGRVVCRGPLHDVDECSAW